MICDQVRESISAELDGEQGPLHPGAVAAHLASCSGCRAWHADVLKLQRKARVTVAPLLSDETERFVAAVHARQAQDARDRHRLLPVQLGLVGVAVVQIVLAAPYLLLGRDGFTPEHVAHELGAFTVAIAVGLLLAAWRPRLANGMVPIVGVVAGLLMLTAWIDEVLRHTHLTAEWPHLLEVAGFLLLLRLAYLSNDRDWTPLLLPLRRPHHRRLHAGPADPGPTGSPPQPDSGAVSQRRRAAGE